MWETIKRTNAHIIGKRNIFEEIISKLSKYKQWNGHLNSRISRDLARTNQEETYIEVRENQTIQSQKQEKKTLKATN